MQKTRVAVLGTLADLHREPIRYDWRCLEHLIVSRYAIRTMQRIAGTPEAINSSVFGQLCDTMCAMTAWLGGPATEQRWDEANQQLVENILSAARRDPGTRTLVTVDGRRRHRLQRQLRQVSDIELVDYRSL